MTGIVLYENGGFVTLQGDSLLTATIGIDQTSSLPILNTKITGNRAVVGQCQKIVVLSSDLLYAWSGSLNEVIKVHSCLQQAVSMTKDDYLYFTKKLIDENINRDLSLIIVRRFEDKSSLVLSKLSIGRSNLPGYGDIYYGGSGQGSLFGEMGDLFGNIPDHLAMINGPKHISDRVQRIRLMDSILETRFLFHKTIDVNMGGALETIVLYPSKPFSKIDNSLYAIWSTELLCPDNLFPVILVKRFYLDGYLCVSLYNYRTKTVKTSMVPNPGNYKDKHIDKNIDWNPLAGSIGMVSCVYLRGVLGIRHYLEDADTFKRHFRYDNLTGRVLCSKAYRDDYLLRCGGGAPINFSNL